MGSHTENMQKIVETLKDSEKGRLEAERQRKTDFKPFIEGVRNRVQEVQEETRGFLKEVGADLRGGAKVWQNYKRGR